MCNKNKDTNSLCPLKFHIREASFDLKRYLLLMIMLVTAAFMFFIMFMMMLTAAFVLIVVVMMMFAAAFMFSIMVVMMLAAAFMIVIMSVTAAVRTVNVAMFNF